LPCRNCFIDAGDVVIEPQAQSTYDRQSARHHNATTLLPIGEKTVEIGMQNDTSELDHMQAAYNAAVEEWIVAIRQEEALASVNHSIAEVDKWEGAHFAEEKIRGEVKAAKKQYEAALRKKFCNF